MPRNQPLTDKQQRFVDEYLIDLNATAAYKRAGYACKNDNAASASAANLLRNPKVQAAIQAGQKKIANKLEITAEMVLRELAALGFGNMGQVMDFSGTQVRLRPANEISEQGRSMLASMKVKRYFEGGGENAREVEVTEFKLWDKLGALAKLGQHLGLFVEKIEHSGKNGAALQIIGVEIAAAQPKPEAPANGSSV